MSVTIEYNGSNVATVEGGKTATLPVENKKMKTDIIVTVPEAEGGTDSAIPIEVSTEAEMTSLLTSGEVGGVYKYTGETTVTYENGALYVIEEDLLQGVWAFNDTVTTVTNLRAPIDFVSNAQAYIKMAVSLKMKRTTIVYVFEDDSGYTVHRGTQWLDTACQTVNISTTFAQLSANYEKANEFLAFMQTNATRQSTGNSFTKLINPSDLEAITITENGYYTPNGDGFSTVKVDVPLITEDSSGVLDAFISGEETEIVSLPTATKIKAYAFYDNDTIQNIEMPNVTSIGEYAFYDNDTIQNIKMPNVTSIGEYAFAECTKLALTSLPSGLTRIDAHAFSNCYALALTSLPSGLTSISFSTFYHCTKLALTSLPSSVMLIFSGAFSGCTDLALTELPSRLAGINDNVFRNCPNLALTSLPSGVDSIGEHAFAECTKLALTSLPSGLTRIDAHAFRNCTGITSLTFKGTPTSIDSTAFNGCTNLTTINVPWAEGAVAGAPWGATSAQINYNYTEES